MIARVSMFVLNPVKYDRRVLREAESLAGSGYEVVVTAPPILGRSGLVASGIRLAS